MLYKNITLAVATLLVAIAATVISSTYYMWKTPDYSSLSEYDGTTVVNIADGVNIENINDLYYDVEEQYYTNQGWKYRQFHIRSIRNKKPVFIEDEKLIFTYNGKRLDFDYEIQAIDGDLLSEDVLSGKPAILKVISKDKNVIGTLEFKLQNRDTIVNQYRMQSLPVVLIIVCAFDLIICIVFAIIDFIRDEGIFNTILLLPSFGSRRRSYSVSTSTSAITEQKRAEEAKSERIKKYEEKYDLTKEDNAVFKEMAYGTLDDLFPENKQKNDANDTEHKE